MLAPDSGQHFRITENLQRRIRHRAAERIAAVGRAVTANIQTGGDGSGSEHGADREAIAETLGVVRISG